MKMIEKQGGNGKVQINFENGTAIKSLKFPRGRKALKGIKLSFKHYKRFDDLAYPTLLKSFRLMIIK